MNPSRALLALLFVFAAVLVGLVTSVSLASAAPTPKIGVCHLNDSGDFMLINVVDRAVPAHLRHGDGLPGDPIKGMGGYEFDSECGPAPLDTDDDGHPDADDNCPTVANADQLDQYGSGSGDACEDTDGDGTPDVAEPNLCVHINGVVILESGTAYCETADGGIDPNIAIADGDTARAQAGLDPGDSGNRATAVGVFAIATARNGSRNNAFAKGDDTHVIAQDGDDNTAEATGHDAYAGAAQGNANTAVTIGDDAESLANLGDGNVATATGVGASALTWTGSWNTVTAIGDGATAGANVPGSPGDNNTAIAEGDGATAVASLGNNNTAHATGVDAIARALNGDWNTAEATGDRASALAHDGNGNTAIADGADSSACAGGGDDGEKATNEDLCG